jgi:hypothetical protein
MGAGSEGPEPLSSETLGGRQVSERSRSVRGRSFTLLPERFCIQRLPADAPLDLLRFLGASWYSITRTQDELSIVAPEHVDVGAAEREPGWSCLQLEGPLDLGMVGVLAGILRVLADAGVSIFSVSTFDTDYVLLRSVDLERALGALRAAGALVKED